MKNFNPRPALTLAVALILHQSAAAVPVVLNSLGLASNSSGLPGAGIGVGGGPGHMWDPVTQKSRMDPISALFGTTPLSSAALAQGGSILPGGVYGSSGVFGVGGALPAAAGGGGQLNTGAQSGPVSQPIGGPAALGAGANAQSPGALGAGANAQGAGVPSNNKSPTTGANGDAGVSYGAGGVALNPNRIGPALLVVTAVAVPDAGSASLLLLSGLVMLLGFGARIRNRGEFAATA